MDKSGYLVLTGPCVFDLTAPDHPIIADLIKDCTTTTVDFSEDGFEVLRDCVSGSAESVPGGVRVTG